MDNYDLLLAVEVRKLAAELQQAEWAVAGREFAKADGDVRQDHYDAWATEFPLGHFVPRAYTQITEVLEYIGNRRADDQAASKSYWESGPQD